MRINFLAILLSCLAISMNAQEELSFGVKAGLNLSDVGTTGTTVPSQFSDFAKPKLGFHVGGLAHFALKEKLGLQAEATFSRQGYKSEGTIMDTSGNPPAVVDFFYHLDYINVPIMASIEPVKGLGIQAGPQFGFSLGSRTDIKIKEGDVQDPSDFEGKGSKGSTLEVGGLLGIQYMLPSNILFQLRYIYGLTGIAPKGEGFKNRNAQLSVGYKF